jgi:hypothetical protein
MYKVVGVFLRQNWQRMLRPRRGKKKNPEMGSIDVSMELENSK